MARKPCYSIAAQCLRDEHEHLADRDVIGVWQIIYLPKGYGPSLEDKIVCEMPWRRGESLRNPPPRVQEKFDELTAALASDPT